MAIRNPSDFFKHKRNVEMEKFDKDVDEMVSDYTTLSFTDTFKTFRENIHKLEIIDSVEDLSEEIISVKNELKSIINKFDESLQESVIFQLTVIEKAVSDLENKINSINRKNTSNFKLDISEINNQIENLRDSVYNNDELNTKVFELEEELGKNNSELQRIDKFLEKNHIQLVYLKNELFSEVKKLNSSNIVENLINVEKKIEKIENLYNNIDVNGVRHPINESLLAPVSTNPEDPLNSLEDKYVTLPQLQDHYRLFLNRIQEQLSSLGGGGEVKFKYLDDVVGIATNGSEYDGKFLTYDHTTETFVFDDVPEQSINISEENIIYVAKDGDDANPGSLSKPKLTIKAAVDITVDDTVVRVAPGTYLEENPIVIPDEVTVMGHSLRETTVVPINPDKDLFHIGNGNYIAEMSFTGSMPGKAIFAFDPENERYITQSPYIQNCTNFIPDSIGMKVDGKEAIGPLRSMVLDSYTQYNQGGIGVSITNSGYAQLVSLFTICNNIAVYCGSGGACDLTNSNSSFGNYGLVADGVSPKSYTGILTVSSGVNDDVFVIDLGTTNSTLGIVTASYNNETGRLTATTDNPHKFNVGVAVSLSNLEFSCPFEPGNRFYPNDTNGYVFVVETVAPGRYIDASNLIISNKKEIQDKSLAAVALASTSFYFPGDEETNERSRYYDSYRLIQNNKQEIIDKSLTSIAVGFPTGFYFPDEDETNNRSRYYDASRLITLNKQEIVDKSLASVAIAHSDFYFPDDTQTNIRSRYYDAYRLIQRNRQVIVDSAWTDTVGIYAGSSYSEDTCKRDLGFFIDAISIDVFTAGNSYSTEFVQQYFDGTSNIGIAASERAPSVYAFESARDLMKNAITNNLVGAAYSDLTITADPVTGSNTDPNSCADVQSNIDTLVGIVTVSIGAGDTASLPVNPNKGYFDLSVGIGTTVSPGGVVCARDLSFLVEAVSTDIFIGGNKYASEFSLQYFDGATPIGIGSTELEPSLTAFNSLRDYSQRAVTNQLNYKEIGISSGFSTYPNIGILEPVYISGNENACIDVQNNIITLVGIVTSVIGAGDTSLLPPIDLGISTTNTCARDLGYLVDAVSTDIFTGGNKYSRDYTRQYFDGDSNLIYINGENEQSVYAFNTLGEYSKKAVTNQLNYKEVGISSGKAEYAGAGTSIPVLLSGNQNSCIDVQDDIDNLVGIVTNVIGNEDIQFLLTFDENTGTFTDGGSKCYRDIGYIIDAVAADLVGFTNENIIDATKKYFDYLGNPLNNGLLGEETESIVAFNASRDLMKLAIANQLNVKDLTLIPDPNPGIGTTSNTNPYSCGSDVGTTIDTEIAILTTAVGAGDTSTIPQVSLASTIFSVDVGIATQPHTYEGGGTVGLNLIRPFDGQVLYFDELFYTVKTLNIIDGGSGYTTRPTVVIEEPNVPWGIRAQAIPIIENGVLVGVDMLSNGRGYRVPPRVTISAGINTAVAIAEIVPEYYTIQKSTEINNGISIITINENVPYELDVGTQVNFYKQSRVLATGHSFEFIGAGTEIANALPFNGGTPPDADKETDSRNGGLVVYTSTNQAGNFKIGDGVIINQNTGSISGTDYTKSLFSTMTPFILSLGGF